MPPELIAHILQYLDEKSKISTRTTNSTLRQLCSIDYFKIYGATSENIPRIVDTFLKIPRPISLSFKKLKKNSIAELSDHLTKLTNLTSLEFDRSVVDLTGIRMKPLG